MTQISGIKLQQKFTLVSNSDHAAISRSFATIDSQKQTKLLSKDFLAWVSTAKSKLKPESTKALLNLKTISPSKASAKNLAPQKFHIVKKLKRSPRKQALKWAASEVGKETAPKPVK